MNYSIGNKTSSKPALLCLIVTAILLASCSYTPGTGEKEYIGLTAKLAVIPFEYALLDTTFGHREVSDIDQDGLNDIVVGHNPDDAGNVAWYRAQSWTRHLIADITAYPDYKAYRSCDMELEDIDGDGDLDVVGRIGKPNSDTEGVVCWFENPLPSADPTGLWKRHDIGKNEYVKDIRTADFDRDGKTDIMTRESKRVQIWFHDGLDIWTKKEIVLHPHDGADVADIDLDGDPDMILNGYWLETPDSARTGNYQEHVIDSLWFTQNTNSWMDNNTRVCAVDLNRDGKVEVIFSQAERPGFPLSWYEAENPKAGLWVEHVIAKGLDYVHSLEAVDFDLDGDIDILAAEMTKGDDPDEVDVFINDGTSLSWAKQVLATTGCYSAAAGDVDNDGDIDILGLHNYDSGPLEMWINSTRTAKNLSFARWHYIQVDNSRGKWGDWAEPKWLKYFGLAMADITGDGYKDIVSGRYFYRNPGGDMSGPWSRVDFGLNVDAMLIVDLDNDSLGDVIAQALPDVYWLEALNTQGSKWKARKIATQTPTDHVNGQGYVTAQITPGGKPEILLEGGDGISYFEIPDDPEKEEWPRILIAKNSYGMGAGDVDRDGRIDVAGFEIISEKDRPVTWWKNPGTGQGEWEKFTVGVTNGFYPDRIALADLNGDQRLDIVVTEETQELVPQWKTYWFEQPSDLAKGEWPRHIIAVQYTTNAMDTADMDADGDLDVITGEHRGFKRLIIWENTGQGVFTGHQVDTGKENHLGARAADLDGDGDLDIIGICWDSYQLLHLWRNDAKSAR